MGDGVTIGVDTYSYHRFLGELRSGETAPAVSFGHHDLLAEVASSGAEVVSLETCYLPQQDAGFLVDMRGWFAERGVTAVLSWGHPSGLAAGTDPGAGVELDRLVVVAAEAGIELVRIVLGGPAQWQAEPERDVVARLVPQLERHLARASDHGVQLAAETHCDLTLPAFAELVERLDQRLGVVLDTGNVVRVGATLPDAVTRLGAVTWMVHAKDLSLRDLRADPQPADVWWCMPVGKGRLPIIEALDSLHARGFVGPVCVELMELDPVYGGDERDAVRESIDVLAAWRARVETHGTRTRLDEIRGA